MLAAAGKAEMVVFMSVPPTTQVEASGQLAVHGN